MKKAFLTVAIIIALSFISSVSWAAPGDSADDPIFISSAEDLANMRTGLYRYYKLANNIDLTSYLSTRTRGWQPIGRSATSNFRFDGELDGGGYTISGLWMSRGEYTGLFGFAGRVTIKNLTVVVAPAGIIGDLYVGALVGNAGMSATIENVSVRAESVGISGRSFIGGLMGHQAGGSITRSHFTGNITGTSHNVGGLVGQQGVAGTVTIEGCSCAANIIGGDLYIGGLVGYQHGDGTSIIMDSHVTGSIVADADYVGGLVGRQAFTGSSVTIARCYVTSSVRGDNYVGGLVGNQSMVIGSETATIDSYVTGDVTANGDYAGGLMGYLRIYSSSEGRVTNSYTTGNVRGNDYVGGLVGRLQNYDGSSSARSISRIANSRATGNVSGGSYTGGLVGFQETFGSNAGISNTIDSCYATGDVTGNEVGGLVGVQYSRSAPVACIIRNSYAAGNVSGRYAGGLVGQQDTGSSSNIIESSYSTGRVTGSEYTGGLVGYQYSFAYVTGAIRSSDSRIASSYAKGNVSGGSSTGGLVGRQETFNINAGTGASIENSYATGDVNGDETGGLVGIQYSRSTIIGSTITNSYAVGNVSGRNTGGLAGQQDTGSSVNKIENSYSAGRVTGVLSSGAFVGQQSGASNDIKGGYRWDMVTVNGATPPDNDPNGIQGGRVSSSDLMTKATYTGASWLFNDSAPVGPWHWDNRGFPKLNIGTENFPFPWDTFDPLIPTITINTQPQATTTVTAGSITGGLSVSASVTPSGTLAYQWYSNTISSNAGGLPITGATGASFSIPTNLAVGTYYYYCVVSATGATSVASNAARVTVEESGGCNAGYGLLTLALLVVGATLAVALNSDGVQNRSRTCRG